MPAESGTWRVGRKVPRNLYRGNEPIAMLATAKIAAELARKLNDADEQIRAKELHDSFRAGMLVAIDLLVNGLDAPAIAAEIAKQDSPRALMRVARQNGATCDIRAMRKVFREIGIR